MPLEYGVVDIHVHIAPWRMVRPELFETLQRTQRTSMSDWLEITENPAKFLKLMDAAGVEVAGLINYVSPDVIGFTAEVNDFVSRYCRQAPDRLIPFGSVHPRFCADPAAEMDRLVQDLGIRAIKVHPTHQLFHANDYTNGLKGLEIVYEKAQAYQIPVMIHTGTSIFPGARNKFGDPMELDDIAVDFPNLKLILAHGGRPLYMDKAFFLVRTHRNIYLEISSIPPQKLLEYFPRLEMIADKTLFGSDWPGPLVPGIRENIAAFIQLPLSEEAKRKILRTTALGLFPRRP